MKITLKTLKGQQLPLEVQPDMTVRISFQLSQPLLTLIYLLVVDTMARQLSICMNSLVY